MLKRVLVWLSQNVDQDLCDCGNRLQESVSGSDMYHHCIECQSVHHLGQIHAPLQTKVITMRPMEAGSHASAVSVLENCK
jgi:hypothetical protein